MDSIGRLLIKLRIMHDNLTKAQKSKHDRCVEHVQDKVDNPHAVCVAAGVEPEKWKKSMPEERIKLLKNGQWTLEKDARDPKLAPKEVKIKQLQQQIDAGTYKPDSKKIAEKIIQHPENPLKKD